MTDPISRSQSPTDSAFATLTANTDSIITESVVEREYADAIRACSNLIPVDRWHVQPGALQYTTRKRAYGMAGTPGDMYINKAFLGTSDLSGLRGTLRHELAHFAAGLHHNHDKVWKRMNKAFGG